MLWNASAFSIRSWQLGLFGKSKVYCHRITMIPDNSYPRFVTNRNDSDQDFLWFVPTQNHEFLRFVMIRCESCQNRLWFVAIPMRVLRFLVGPASLGFVVIPHNSCLNSVESLRFVVILMTKIRCDSQWFVPIFGQFASRIVTNHCDLYPRISWES